MNYFDLYYQIVSREKWFYSECAIAARKGSPYSLYIRILSNNLTNGYETIAQACKFLDIYNEYNKNF